MCTSESSVKELKQYGRRLCHHIASVPVVENEASEDVFNNILDICKKGNISISKNDIDCMFRIGKPYVDNISKKHCKSIIVRFTSFHKLTLVYCRKKSIKDVRLKFNLTKKGTPFL